MVMRTPKGSLTGLLVLLAILARTGLAEEAVVELSGASHDPLCDGSRIGFGASLDPQIYSLQPTQHAPGGRGSMTLAQPSSPFGILVDVDGHQTYRVTVQIDQLRRRSGTSYVAWVATPELDKHVRLEAIDGSDRFEGSIGWNQFLVFVSEEASPDVEKWDGPILLTGLSPSGRMHTMAGHGPFDDVSCADVY